jgi:hypothetical protein
MSSFLRAWRLIIAELLVENELEPQVKRSRVFDACNGPIHEYAQGHAGLS